MTSSQPAERAAGPQGAFEGLLRRTHMSSAADLAPAVAEEARAFGLERLVLYVVDYEQSVLIPVPAPDAEGRSPVRIEGTLAGRAYASSAIVAGHGAEDGGRTLWLPLLDGTDRIGALEAVFREPPSEDTVRTCERYAHLVAMLVVSKSAYSDWFERLRRRAPMTAASELLWAVTPPLVLATDDLVVAAMLEPVHDMGGDAFDYALNGDVLHFAVFDAMGHGLAAAGVSAFALAAYRNIRRRGRDLVDTYAAIDAAIGEQYPTSRFVTAIIAELDVPTGHLRWISAGHPAPLVLRGGQVVKTLHVAPAPPAGMGLARRPPAEGQETLEPGDMVLLYTDGLTEARRPGGGFFTAERLGHFIEREAASGRPAPETLRRLREAIIGREEGALHDDATALLVEWRRGSERSLLPQTV